MDSGVRRSFLCETPVPTIAGVIEPGVQCESCDLTVPRPDAHLFEIGGVVRFLCPACADDSRSIERAQLRGADTRRAVVFGSVTAALAAALWYFIVVATGLEVGLIAAAVGWVTAAGVQYGAGPWRGRRLQWLSVLLTLISLVLAQFLITRLLLQRFVESEYGERIAIPADLALTAMKESIVGDPAILAFWAIALISAYQLTSRVGVIAPSSRAVGTAA